MQKQPEQSRVCDPRHGSACWGPRAYRGLLLRETPAERKYSEELLQPHLFNEPPVKMKAPHLRWFESRLRHGLFKWAEMQRFALCGDKFCH